MEVAILVDILFFGTSSCPDRRNGQDHEPITE